MEQPTSPHRLASGLSLILGGAGSGKSVFAEGLAQQAARPVYCATAEARDAEMTARIDTHRRRRGPRWSTVEVPLALPAVLPGLTGPDAAVLVDCLTLWLTNLMLSGRTDAALETETTALLAACRLARGPVLMVSNEVGLGIVPDNALARQFRDRAGRLHQAVAAQADRVFFMVAGLPMVVKGN